MHAPDEVLAQLRELSGADQMAVFAEALYMRPGTGRAPHGSVSLIAAAYMLGRVDGAHGKITPDGVAGPMAEAVLRAGYALERLPRNTSDDLPF